MLKNEKSILESNFITYISRNVAKLVNSKDNLSKEWWNENT
jgi:hypothetical protein